MISQHDRQIHEDPIVFREGLGVVSLNLISSSGFLQDLVPATMLWEIDPTQSGDHCFLQFDRFSFLHQPKNVFLKSARISQIPPEKSFTIMSPKLSL